MKRAVAAEPSGRKTGRTGSAGAPVAGWTTVADLRARSRTAWDRGTLLHELLTPTDVYPRRRPLKRPTATQLREHYAAAHRWAADLRDGAGDYALETSAVGSRTIGTNEVPSGAIFGTVHNEIAFVGETRSAGRFVDLVRQLADADPVLRQWAAKRPLTLLDMGADALTAATVALWFRDNPAPGIYLRQLSLPGVHTKFVEAHRRVIDEMVALLEPGRAGTDSSEAKAAEPETAASDLPESIPAESIPAATGSAAARFARRHGFLTQPELVRFRLLDPSMSLAGAHPGRAIRDVTLTAGAFSTLDPAVQTVIVTENLTNFLALPELPATLAVFGAGYGFSAVRQARWLDRCEILYWGDLDTHGFRILDQLRSAHPHAHSLLMDIGTLLAHREFWGRESVPSRVDLTRLTPEETDVYAALRDGSYGPAIRLEQEQIRWDWAMDRIGRQRPGN